MHGLYFTVYTHNSIKILCFYMIIFFFSFFIISTIGEGNQYQLTTILLILSLHLYCSRLHKITAFENINMDFANALINGILFIFSLLLLLLV